MSRGPAGGGAGGTPRPRPRNPPRVPHLSSPPRRGPTDRSSGSAAVASARWGLAVGDHEWVFLRRAVRDQLTVGAVAPTSTVLARTMVGLVGPLSGRLVVELGAGTGAISQAVGPELGPGTRHVAVERDPTMLARLAAVAPWALRLPGDAADLVALLDRAGVVPAAGDLPAHAAVAPGGGGVDVVLSSLPWSYFPALQRATILDQIRQVLAPGGVFATIAYRPTRLTARSRAFRADLGSMFAQVTTTPTVWANIPPARIHLCRHPSGPGHPSTPTRR